MSINTATRMRLTRREKGGREYSEIWQLRANYWHMEYDSEGTAEYERIAADLFDQYIRCFDKNEVVP